MRTQRARIRSPHMRPRHSDSKEVWTNWHRGILNSKTSRIDARVQSALVLGLSGRAKEIGWNCIRDMRMELQLRIKVAKILGLAVTIRDKQKKAIVFRDRKYGTRHEEGINPEGIVLVRSLLEQA